MHSELITVMHHEYFELIHMLRCVRLPLFTELKKKNWSTVQCMSIKCAVYNVYILHTSETDAWKLEALSYEQICRDHFRPQWGNLLVLGYKTFCHKWLLAEIGYIISNLPKWQGLKGNWDFTWSRSIKVNTSERCRLNNGLCICNVSCIYFHKVMKHILVN